MKYSELKPWQKVIADACRKDPGLVDLLRPLIAEANAETTNAEQSNEPKE